MRQGLVLGLLALLFAGCATQGPIYSTSWLERLRTLPGPAGPDVIWMDVALLERPLADSYIDQEVWTLVDEQVIDYDRKAALEDNGLRVGQIDGITPGGLQKLLESKRSCANPRRRQFHAGESVPPLVLGPLLPVCSFEMQQEGRPVEVKLEQAQCNLALAVSLTKDGRTRLQFTPQILHGETQMVPRPNPAVEGGWELKQQQPTETYANLSWEVTLAPNAYVVVGARSDRPGTLGHQCFVRGDESPPVQRLLVIRTGRSTPSPTGGSISDVGEGEPLSGQATPLALQATWSTVRGSER